MLRRYLIIVFIIYSVLVSYFCLSIPSGITNIGSWDKIAHALTYAGFGILSCLIAITKKQLFFLMLLCIFYGIAIEYLQSLISYRTASLNDVLANFAGLFIGLMISRLIHYFFPLPFLKKPIKHSETMT